MFNPQPRPEKKPKEKLTAKEFKKKYSKPRSKSINALKKELDDWFSRRVRLEEATDGYIGKCVDCGQRIDIRRADLGHYHSRTYTATRWERMNVALQKKRCNMMMGDPKVNEGFKTQLIFRYGSDRFERLNIQKNNFMKLDRNLLGYMIAEEKKLVESLLIGKGLDKWW